MIKTSRSSMVALAWGSLLSEFTILLFHEKVVFDSYFTQAWHYVVLGACAFSAFLLVTVISKFIDGKFLAVSCFLISMVVAMAWFTIGWNLPTVPTTIGCNLLICGIPGQLLVILLMISVHPPFLIEFTRRIRNGKESKDLKITPMAVMIAGGMISFSGFAAYTTYVATPILLAPIAGMGAIAVVFMATCGKIDLTIDTRDAKGVKVDLILSIRDLLTSIVISAISFSMLASSSFSFKLLGEIGISMVIFGIVLHVVTKLRPPGDALHLLEGNLIALLLASTWMLARFLDEGMAITRASGLPEFIIGFSLAYILARMVNA
ncbi:hypothetical protein GF325_15925, partial [Candidatus Bathyarchaeota archaeon]|nr:hypothetical protein [Candidatus Bathyarchaeota archaeon]